MGVTTHTQPGFLNLFVNSRNIDGCFCVLLVASYGVGLRDLITIESDGLIKLEQHHWGPHSFIVLDYPSLNLLTGLIIDMKSESGELIIYDWVSGRKTSLSCRLVIGMKRFVPSGCLRRATTKTWFIKVLQNGDITIESTEGSLNSPRTCTINENVYHYVIS